MLPLNKILEKGIQMEKCPSYRFLIKERKEFDFLLRNEDDLNKAHDRANWGRLPLFQKVKLYQADVPNVCGEFMLQLNI